MDPVKATTQITSLARSTWTSPTRASVDNQCVKVRRWLIVFDCWSGEGGGDLGVWSGGERGCREGGRHGDTGAETERVRVRERQRA